jgi:hypothetical protein
MDTMQKPTYYLKEEGGEWEPWPFGYLNINDLDTHIKDLVDLSVLPIMAVKFSNGAIWSIKDGWITLAVDEILESIGDSLNEAHAIINGERQDTYRNPEDSFLVIAQYWSNYLQQVYNSDHHHLRALDVAHMMMLFKIARCSGQKTRRDNYIDIQVYAAIAADRLVKE